MIVVLQYVRALCALAVTWHHAREQLVGLPEMFPYSPGPLGTTTLMLISGFVAMVSTSYSTPPGQFLIKRFMRITPLYWIATLAVAAITLSSPESFKSTVVTFDTLIQSLLYVPHASLGHAGYIWPLLYPGWTLHYIAFFYLLFAACMAASHAQRGRLAMLTMLVLIGIGQTFHFEEPVLKVYTNRLLLTFIIGMALGEWHLNRVRAQSVTDLAKPNNGFLKFMTLIGNASFSIYLTHMFALVALRILWKEFIPTPESYWDATAFMLLSLAVSVLLGWWVYAYVELPLAAWTRRKLTDLGVLRESSKGPLDARLPASTGKTESLRVASGQANPDQAI